MTCPACGFENLSRSLTCARCGTKLVWDGPADQDYFHPPRASHGKTPYILRRLRLRVEQAWQHIPEPRRKAAAWSVIIPGLGHFFLREIFQGLGLLTSWLTIGVAFFSLRAAWPQAFLHLASPLWFTAMLIHTLAVVSAAGPHRYGRTAKETRGLALILAGLILGLYLTMGLLIQPLLTVTIYQPIYQPMR